MPGTEVLAERLADIRERLSRASEGRYPVPKLIAVTKTHPAETILPLWELGVRDIGENHVQEIVQKLPVLEDRFNIHCIGRLQTNKVKQLAGHVALIHSVDRLKLAQEIDRQAQQRGIVIPVLIQVSPAGEEQKGGIAPDEVRGLLRAAACLPGISVRGLMAVMPDTPDQQLLGSLFGNMRTLFEQLRDEAIDNVRMDELSMGMSHDYELAARFGATMVRVGSALFGPRDYSKTKE